MADSQSKASQEAEDLAQAELELSAELNASPEIHMKGVEEKQDWDEEMVPVPVNEDMLRELLDMGFTDVRARKALVHGGSVDGALTWLDEHQEDADIDQPYMVRKSDTIPKPPLTAEEKAKKIEEMRQRIENRRNERTRNEKEQEIKAERDRRERGQKMEEVMEERAAAQRKRDFERQRREKEEQAKERARLKAEIARDKEIRRLNKGVLPSVLGVDGYNPSAIQYDKQLPEGEVPATTTTNTASTAGKAVAPAPAVAPKAVSKPIAAAPPAAAAALSPEALVDQSIATISRYRTGGDGGQALKLLVTFVKNIVENPSDPKYRSINPDSNAYKSKIAPLVGPALLLKTVGFETDEVDGKLKYNGATDNPLLVSTLGKLVRAEADYRAQNP